MQKTSRTAHTFPSTFVYYLKIVKSGQVFLNLQSVANSVKDCEILDRDKLNHTISGFNFVINTSLKWIYNVYMRIFYKKAIKTVI